MCGGRLGSGHWTQPQDDDQRNCDRGVETDGRRRVRSTDECIEALVGCLAERDGVAGDARNELGHRDGKEQTTRNQAERPFEYAPTRPVCTFDGEGVAFDDEEDEQHE